MTPDETCTIPTLDDASFDRVITSASVPVCIHFVERACRDCGTIERSLADLASRSRGRVQCYCIPGGSSPQVKARWAVVQFPTILLFRGGKVVRRLVGHPLPEELDLILRLETADIAGKPTPSDRG